MTTNLIKTEALERSYNAVRQKWDPHFEWVVNDSAPWSPLARSVPLSQTALALVGTCGAYRRGADCPFDAANYYGDPSFKEIPRDTEPGALEFAHTHYDHAHVAQDPNVGFPLGLLRALEAEGVIGRFVDPTISFTGFLPQTRQLLTDTAPAAAKRLLEAGAQTALLVPC